MGLIIASNGFYDERSGECVCFMVHVIVDVGKLTARVGPTDERAMCVDERLTATLGRIILEVCMLMKQI